MSTEELCQCGHARDKHRFTKHIGCELWVDDGPYFSGWCPCPGFRSRAAPVDPGSDTSAARTRSADASKESQNLDTPLSVEPREDPLRKFHHRWFAPDKDGNVMSDAELADFLDGDSVVADFVADVRETMASLLSGWVPRAPCEALVAEWRAQIATWPGGTHAILEDAAIKLERLLSTPNRKEASDE